MSLQLTALHALLALSLEGTQHNQLVQQVPHQQAGLVALLEGELLAIHGTEAVLLHEVLQALETVRVPTGRVHGLQQGLQADVADQLVVHLVLEVVEVIVQQGVGLATLAAQLGGVGRVFLGDGVGHGSASEEIVTHLWGKGHTDISSQIKMFSCMELPSPDSAPPQGSSFQGLEGARTSLSTRFDH